MQAAEQERQEKISRLPLATVAPMLSPLQVAVATLAGAP